MGKRARSKGIRKPPKRKRSENRGHPARRTRADKQRAWWSPDPTDKLIRDISRRARDRSYELIGKEGPLTGLVQVAAEFAAEQIVKHHDLPGDSVEHERAVACQLTELLGATIDGWTPAGYWAWRAG